MACYRVIETSLFTKQLKQIATDDELTVLQQELIAQPMKGDLITGTAEKAELKQLTKLLKGEV